jgi:MFS family permease
MTQIGKPPGDDTLIRHGCEAVPCPKASKPWVLAAAIVGSSMAFIDGTVVNVALPAIQNDLRATAFQAQWVVESYALFLAALLLAGGALGDRFGRRRIFALGIVIFALASVGCALAGSVQQLILARAVQGIGGALLVPGSLALISASFPEKERGRAIGTWSGFSGITAAIGPVVGGFLVDHYSWIWAFLVNVPMAIAVLLIVWRHVPESRGSTANGGLDLWGAALATVALGGIVYAFIEAPTQGWNSPAVLAALASGLAASAAFVVVEGRVRSPMLPLSLMRIGNFGGANLLTLLLYAALGGGLYFFPLNLIQVQGYSATVAGAALLPFILIMFAVGLGRAAGGPLRPAAAAGGGSGHRSGGLRAVRSAGRRRQLLDRLPPGRGGARLRHDDHGRAAHDHGDERGRTGFGRHRIGRQQRGIARSLGARDRGLRRGDGLGLRRDAGPWPARGGRIGRNHRLLRKPAQQARGRGDAAGHRYGRGRRAQESGRRILRGRFPLGHAALRRPGAAECAERVDHDRPRSRSRGRSRVRAPIVPAPRLALARPCLRPLR